MLKKLLYCSIMVSLIALMMESVFSQSGRRAEENKKKPTKKVDPPPPMRPPNLPVGSEDDPIRINSDLVTVVTTIAKKPAEEIGRLTPEDFEVFEDGVKQEISNFGFETDQPLNMVLLFDTSLSVAQKLSFEKKAAAKFFERILRPQDRIALFSVSTDVQIIQGFTNKISDLTSSLKVLVAQGATSLYDGIYLASDYLKPAEGRRIIAIISDGADSLSNKTLLEALKQAQDTDAVIFAVFTGNSDYSQNLRDLAGERALETLCSETGGDLLKPRVTPGILGNTEDEKSIKELDNAFISLANQLRTQYTLGFYSNNEKRDGSFRKLKVKVKKQGYVIRARMGYYSPKA